MVYAVVTVKYRTNLDGTLVKELKLFDSKTDAEQYYDDIAGNGNFDHYLEELDFNNIDAQTAQTIYDTLIDL